MISHSPEKFQEVYQTANNCFQKKPDWVTFFREIMGVKGLIHRSFDNTESLAAFEKSEEYSTIQQMLVNLRGQKTPKTPIEEEDGKEETRVITVRLPESLHESLRIEAHGHHISVNKLCISKLLQLIEEDMIPQRVA